MCHVHPAVVTQGEFGGCRMNRAGLYSGTGGEVRVTPPTRFLRDEKWLKPNTPPPLSCAPAPSFARGLTVAMTLDN